MGGHDRETVISEMRHVRCLGGHDREMVSCEHFMTHGYTHARKMVISEMRNDPWVVMT